MSKEQQAQEQPQVAIPLPKAKKNLVQIGCICMMLSVAMYGLVFATLTAPILEKVDAMGYVGLFSIVGAIGVSIMTPIGGKLGDLIGRRNIVVIPGIICALAGFAFAFVRSLIPLMILRLIVSLAQGAFTAAPYIIAGLINERKDVPKAMGMLAAAVAVGGFGGSIIAGILTDMNMLTVAIIMPAAPLLIGIILIGRKSYYRCSWDNSVSCYTLCDSFIFKLWFINRMGSSNNNSRICFRNSSILCTY